MYTEGTDGRCVALPLAVHTIPGGPAGTSAAESNGGAWRRCAVCYFPPSGWLFQERYCSNMFSGACGALNNGQPEVTLSRFCQCGKESVPQVHEIERNAKCAQLCPPKLLIKRSESKFCAVPYFQLIASMP